MRNLIFTATAALILAGCGNNPQTNQDVAQTSATVAPASGNAAQMKIADIDLFNVNGVGEISKTLEPADAVLFLEYVVRWKAAKVSGDTSKVVKPDGTAPVTIAEAVELTRSIPAQ
jgi:uncharacterized protein YcfL